MVFCGLCKQSRDTTHTWYVEEQIREGNRKVRVCDNCAALLLRRMTKKVMGVRAEQNLEHPVNISNLGVLNDIMLDDDNTLEITVAIEIGKARRWVEKEQEQKNAE